MQPRLLQRPRRRHAHRLRAWQGAERRGHSLEHRQPARGIRVAVLAERDRGVQDPFAREPEVGAQERDDGPDHQRRAGNQRERRGNFECDERRRGYAGGRRRRSSCGRRSGARRAAAGQAQSSAEPARRSIAVRMPGADTTSRTRVSIASAAAPPGAVRPSCCWTGGAIASSVSLVANNASSDAAVPSTSASASSMRAIAQRPAPSAIRTAISFCRRVARMSSSVATLPQATRSTRAAAAVTVRSSGRTRRRTAPCAETTSARQFCGHVRGAEADERRDARAALCRRHAGPQPHHVGIRRRAQRREDVGVGVEVPEALRQHADDREALGLLGAIADVGHERAADDGRIAAVARMPEAVASSRCSERLTEVAKPRVANPARRISAEDDTALSTRGSL